MEETSFLANGSNWYSNISIANNCVTKGIEIIGSFFVFKIGNCETRDRVPQS